MLSKTFSVNNDIAMANENDVCVIRNNKKQDILVTNSIGKNILNYKGEKIETIITNIHAEFTNLKREKIQEDVLEFIKQCIEKDVGVIE
ncbi:PqqD family peptide modification chaperone [Proteinivorax tanatarense]|uniref:PqqD family peptide modification chaperone n=1 Tax=Proteinivorax tanatarense TaxID=1260629 RepID=A0AAU7VK72_9FIRM